MQALQRVESAIEKAKRLKETNAKLHTKTEELEAEIKRLKQQLNGESAAKAELLNQIKIIKLARNIGSGNTDNAEVTELKRKINEYIKEIDSCITLLND
jgi:phage shock protein A